MLCSRTYAKASTYGCSDPEEPKQVRPGDALEDKNIRSSVVAKEWIEPEGDAVHSVGGLLVIDCIASGCVWLDMQTLGIDVLISAPQKGWASTPCAGLVMLNQTAIARVDASESTSFGLDLKQWLKFQEHHFQIKLETG